MDSFVGAIMEYSKKENDHDHLIKLLETNFEKLRTQANHIGSAVKALDPKKHSIGIVYLLYVFSLFVVVKGLC